MLSFTAIWNFFSSVKLALFTLSCLALTSILGTLIPQKENADFYIQKFGNQLAIFFALFDLSNMYTSWWFLALLGLLSANLIICSIDRFPLTYRLITKNNLSLSLDKIAKTGISYDFNSSHAQPEVAGKINSILSQRGWKALQTDKKGTFVLFSQKTPWSRVGVYIVHLSILIIFAGAIYGQLTGFRGGIMLPELQSSNIVFPYENKEPIPLNFEIRCERFDIDFYATGAPQLFRSKLTLLKDGQIILQKDIEVNDPLQYKGITFYQSSYQAYRDFIFSIAEENQQNTTFSGEFQKEVIWQEKNISFGIINLETVRDRITRLKIWLSDGKDEPSVFWMKNGEHVHVSRPDTTYLFSAKQRYATGLQVVKDPGVWIVYLGCGLMLLGLYITFFLAHQRIWIILRHEDQKTMIAMRGTTNKNKAGFEKSFKALAQTIRENV